MSQSKYSKFLPLPTIRNSHLRRTEIQTFWNTPDISRISSTASAILATSSSALLTGGYKPGFSYDLRTKNQDMIGRVTNWPMHRITKSDPLQCNVTTK